MIGFNTDPASNNSYDTLDYAAYPYMGNNYVVYHNSSLVSNSGAWSPSAKCYIVYGTDGTIKHYNGTTLLYNVNYGTGNTVAVDTSLNNSDATYGGFTDIRVTRSIWNGTNYV